MREKENLMIYSVNVVLIVKQSVNILKIQKQYMIYVALKLFCLIMTVGHDHGTFVFL